MLIRLPVDILSHLTTLKRRLCDFGFALKDTAVKPSATGKCGCRSRVITIPQFRSDQRRGSEPANVSLSAIASALTLSDYNLIFFRCDDEEQVDGGARAYDIPNYGRMIYAGLMGLVPVLDTIRARNDLGHALCANVRAGDWMAEYIIGRLVKYNAAENVSDAGL